MSEQAWRLRRRLSDTKRNFTDFREEPDYETAGVGRACPERSRAHVGSAGGTSRAFVLRGTTLSGNDLRHKRPRGGAAAPTRGVRASFGDLPRFWRELVALPAGNSRQKNEISSEIGTNMGAIPFRTGSG